MIRDLKPLDGLLQRMTIFLLKPTFMALKNELPLKHLMKKTQLNNAVASSTSTSLLQIFSMSSISKPSNLAPSPQCQQENSLQCLNSAPCKQSYQRTEPCPQVEKCVSSIPSCYGQVNTDCLNLPQTLCPSSCPCCYSESPKQSPPKICYRKCLPLLKLLRLPEYHKIPARPPPPLPKHPKRLKCSIQCVPFSSPSMPKCPEFFKCSLMPKEHPSAPPCEPCPRSLSCTCFPSLCPLSRPSTSLKPLTYTPPPPLRSCLPCPECSPPPPCPSPLPCTAYLYSELSPPCSCSKTCPRSRNIKAKYSKDVSSYHKFLSDTGRSQVQRMSTYRIRLRPTQAQMLRSRGLHSSCILLKSNSEKDCKSVSEICKMNESCSKPCKDREAECYPEKVKCEPSKHIKIEVKEEKIVCPKSCVRAGKCIIAQIKKPDKMVYGPTDCPPPKLITPPVCPPTVDSEIEEPICNEKRVKPKKVCTPPPLPGPPTEPISLCPCPPPPKIHPGPCPCPPPQNDIRVKPGRPCPVKDKYPCCLPSYYCPIKSGICVRKPPCDKKKNTKS